MATQKSARTRVAILGGGISALTTAWHLTSTPELRDRYSITVYQMGWRLGGKLASGRNTKLGMRNQEHGLHVWFGWYENAFALFQQLLAEWLPMAPADCPIQQWQDAFEPCLYTPLGQQLGGERKLWKFKWAGNSDLPGDGKVLLSPKAVIVGTLQWMETLVVDWLLEPQGANGDVSGPAGMLARAAGLVSDAFAKTVDKLQERSAHVIVSGLISEVERLHDNHAMWGSVELKALRASLEAAQWMLRPLLHDLRHKHDDADAHLVRNCVDVGLAVLRGFLNPEYQLLEHDLDLDRIDHLELRKWLIDNGADRHTVNEWTVIKALYDAMFEYPNGDSKTPNYAAGVATRVMIRMLLTYKGAPLYLLNTGMGEAVIAPMYETLKARGVNFKFFHKVTNVRASADGSYIEGLDIARQVKIRSDFNGGDYQPLFTVKGMRCWPADPLWEQIEGGEALEQAGVDLESNWCQQPPVETRHLQAGRDFDQVVMGIALGAWKDLGYPGDLGQDLRAKNAKLRQMAAALPIMPSGGVQLWCDRTTSGLGYEQPGVPKARVAGVSIAPPMDVWADMTPTIATEDWGMDGPASVQYLCGTFDCDLYKQPPTDATVPQRARDRLLALMALQLNSTGAVMWPAARHGSDFDWNVLHADPAAEGIERLDQQWIRANVDPTECCVSSPANTTQLRLRADQTGVDNLWLCGECAYTGVNSTCVESVVMAGMQAARAMSGQPLTVVGETFLAGRWRTGQ